MARPLSQTAQATMEQLVRRLEVGASRTIDTGAQTFMALHVDRVSERRYALAHRYVQNGDSMADPDMEFYRAPDGTFYACTFQQDNVGLHQVGLDIDDVGHIRRQDMRIQADLTRFTTTWLRNVRKQQAGYFHIEKLLDQATVEEGPDGKWSACGLALEPPPAQVQRKDPPPVVAVGKTRDEALSALADELATAIAWQQQLRKDTEERLLRQAQQKGTSS